jgi:hypothetical protein
MLLARIICSDPECSEELDVAVATLDELDGYVCECGHGYVLITVSEAKSAGGQLVELPRRRSRGAARRAA